MLFKILGTLFFLLTGMYCGWRFFVSLRYADEKITPFSFFKTFRYFLLLSVVYTIFGLYDIWVHSTLTPVGAVTAPYIDILVNTGVSFWGGFNLAELFRSPYTRKRKIYDSLSILCILVSGLLITFAQGM